MSNIYLTNSEYAILGLLVEEASHGYDLEQKIEERGMREWTEIGFSSIYFVLGKLKKKGFVISEASTGQKTRKTFSVTIEGYSAHKQRTYDAIAVPQALYPSILMALANWPTLEDEQALVALKARLEALRASLDSVKQRQIQQSPVPDFVDVLFGYSINHIEAEIAWVIQTISSHGGKNEKS